MRKFLEKMGLQADRETFRYKIEQGFIKKPVEKFIILIDSDVRMALDLGFKLVTFKGKVVFLLIMKVMNPFG